MNAEICREFSFDAAHLLPHHSGKCSKLHGHTYRIRFYVAGPVKRIEGSSDEGMVLDFGLLSQAYKEHLEPLLDHRYLNESLQISAPTAELVAAWALTRMSSLMPGISRVRVYETPTAYAEVWKEGS